LAANKVTRSRRRREVVRFPQAKGKIVADVELSISAEYSVVDIRFQDKTSLTFDLHPCFQVTPVLADWKTGDYRLLKRWQPVGNRLRPVGN
jgi:hypothetical protein